MKNISINNNPRTTAPFGGRGALNVIFISPHFPLHFYNFSDRLKRLGANVLSIGDCPYDSLGQEVKESVTEYYFVSSLEDYDQVMRAVAFYIHKYGKIDYIESQNEYWLQLEARLRTDFNVPNGWRLDEMESVKLKSKMKLAYKRAKVKTARHLLIEDRDKMIAFANKVHYPIVIKPDNGVGASNTYKITDEAQLLEVLEKITLDGTYIMEEFVPGHIETFDGITNAEGDVLFYTGQVMAVTPLAMLMGAGENVSYTQPVEQIDDLREAGIRTVKAFDVRSRFFHFEFFRLDENKPGLGKRGDILGLEVNMRAPGGYIPDKMNYAYDVDVYQIWAESLVLGVNRSFPDWKFSSYVTHFGRGGSASYIHSAEDIRREFGDSILIDKVPPSSISGGMGSQVFILRSTDRADIARQAEYILGHEDGSIIELV